MSVDILIPTYNRKKFEKLIAHNINSQDYDNIRSVIVFDDGDKEQKLDLDIKVPLDYVYCKRCSIAEKRNQLIKHSKAKYCVFFDTDDIYHPQRISSQIYLLQNRPRAWVTGSSDMLFFHIDEPPPVRIRSMRCVWQDYLNEATIAFERNKMLNRKFKEHIDQYGNHTGEGVEFLRNCRGHIAQCPIEFNMICICHSSNTIPKNHLMVDKYIHPGDISSIVNQMILPVIDILNEIKNS